MRRIVYDGDSFYELDEECMKKKEEERRRGAAKITEEKIPADGNRKRSERIFRR